MEVKDIRLIDASAPREAEALKKNLMKTIDDAKDKFDCIEIEHAPIRLLDRVRSRQSTAGPEVLTPDITDADQD